MAQRITLASIVTGATKLRGGAIAISPFDPDLIVVGVDALSAYGAEHPLAQMDRIHVDYAARAPLRASLRADGFHKHEASTVVRDGKRFLVSEGRGRILETRRVIEEDGTAGTERELVVWVLVESLTEEEQYIRATFGGDGKVERDPIARLLAYRDGMRRYGWSEAYVAQRAGWTPAVLSARWRLLDLSDEARAKVASGAVSIAAGVALAELPRAAQGKALEAIAGEGKTATPERVKAAKARAEDPTTKTRERPGAPTLKRLYKALEAGRVESLTARELLGYVLGKIPLEDLHPSVAANITDGKH